MIDYWRDTENTGFASLAVSGADERTITNTLLSVKYFIDEKEKY